MKALKKKSENVYGSWTIRIPYCNSTIVDAWLKPDDGKTKYGETCEYNFDNKGYYFDTGVATADHYQPNWCWDDHLNQGVPLIFHFANKDLRFGGWQSRRILNIQEEVEFSGHWQEKFNGIWRRVGSRK